MSRKTKHFLNKYSNIILLACCTLLINALLFIGIPLLSQVSVSKETEYYSTPTIISPAKKKIEEQKEKKKQKKPKEKQARTKPKKVFKVPQKQVKPRRPDMDFKRPQLDLELNTKIKQGMRVSAPPPDPAPSTPEPAPTKLGYELGEVDQAPQILRKVNPMYPYSARRKNLTGKVVLKFLVNSNGGVEKVSVVKAEPEGVFEESARQAVRKWRFQPGVYQGEPVATWVVLPIQFNMSG
jgi:protein TonB